MRPRQVIFWLHLSCGLIAGLVIAIMSFTGVLLAFATEVVSWAERDAGQVDVPAAGGALSLTDLEAKVLEAHPELRAPTITLRNDPASAIVFSAGRDDNRYVNPYTGEIRQPASTRVRDFLRAVLEWHRFLGREGEARSAGRLINGICNLAFCLLAVTGLWLWMPRNWSWCSVKAVAFFRGKLSGRARDFNWHNVIGLWCAPVLIVVTLTAVPISFRWGGNLIYRAMGEQPPVQPVPGGGGGALAVEIARPAPDAKPLGYDAIVANVQRDFPRWETINLRSGALQRGGARPSAGDTAPRPGGPQPLTVTVRETGSWPRTATTTLTLDPFTGEVLKREGHDDLSPATRVRRWTRFLHTGEALGRGGQFVAGLASLGGVFLVYTGFALSWRRFFGRRNVVPALAAVETEFAGKRASRGGVETIRSP